jgi:hypothetical protein
MGETKSKCSSFDFAQDDKSELFVHEGDFVEPAGGFEELAGARAVGGADEAVALH